MPITKVNSLGVSLTSPVTFSAGTAALPSITTSGDTNTGVFFPAADTTAFTEGGAEAMRIDSSGRLLVGIDTSRNQGYGEQSSLQLEGTSFTKASIGLMLNSNNTDGPSINFGKSRGTVVGSNTVVQNGDLLGLINFGGADGTDSAAGARISCSVDGTPGNNDMPGRLVFQTTPDGTASPEERMRINASGSLILAGSTAQKASGTTWSNPSDTRLKDNKQNYTKGLEELLQINVKTWEWNGKAGTTEGTTGIGVIADEIEVLLPNTVDTYKAKLNIDDTEETDVKRFDATEITWLLLNSIKEQQAIIEQLKTRLTALESK